MPGVDRNSRVWALADSGALAPAPWVAVTWTLYSVPLSTPSRSMEVTPPPTKVSSAAPGAADSPDRDAGVSGARAAP